MTRLAETVIRFGVPAFILTLPLEFTVDLFKLQLARIVLLVVGAAYVYLVATKQRTLVLPLSASTIVLAIYVAASVISWLFTRAPGSSHLLGDVVAYPVMAILIVNLTRTERAHRDAWMAFMVSGLVVALLVGFLYYTHLTIWRPDPTGRINATFGDPNVTARFLTLVSCAAIVLFAGSKLSGRLAVAAAGACTAFATFTFSKSALVFLPLTVLTSAVFGTSRRRAAAIAAITLLVFGSAVLLTPSSEARAVLVLQAITGHAADAGGSGVAAPSPGSLAGGHLDWVRVYLITAGLQMFRDHLVFGVGFGGYQHAILTTYKSFITSSPPTSDSHTSAITILAEQGLVGVILFGAFLLLLLREVIGSLRRRTEWRDWIITPAALVIPIILFSQLEGRFIEEPYLWLALGLLFSARSLEKSIRTLPIGR